MRRAGEPLRWRCPRLGTSDGSGSTDLSRMDGPEAITCHVKPVIVLNFGYPILLPGAFAIGLDEVGPQFLQEIEILLCGVSIAAPRCAKSTGEHQSRFSVRKIFPRKCPLLG